MTQEEYRQGKIKVIEKSILQCENYLISEEAMKHRNITASCKRRLNHLKESLPRFKDNQLSKEDIYYYHQLYKDKTPEKQ